MTRVAVDLTPLMPDGSNGGAKLVATELVRHLSQSAGDVQFILLTSQHSHEYLSFLDSENVHRICIKKTMSSGARSDSFHKKVSDVLEKWTSIVICLDWIKRKVSCTYKPNHLLTTIGVDLLFCPFTGPQYYHPGVPLVCLIHDVQFIFHPANFTPLELYRRKKQFREACKLSQAVICDSDFVRKTLLDAKFVASDRIHRIYLRISSRLHKFFPVEHSGQFLKTLHLETNHFLLYPANFWPHKNHHLLLRAFAMYHNRHPDSDLRLVCVGNPLQSMQRIEEETTLLNIHKWVSFPGFISDHELAALFQSCLALIHPSLYEGFGLPLLEAMAFYKPVLCSSLGSLPEVAGDAALYFDPRNVDEIVARIEEIETNQELVKALIKKGQRRLTHFGDPAEMAKEYLDVFYSVIRLQQTSECL